MSEAGWAADRRETLIPALQHDVRVLASDIGERNTARYGNLDRAATFIDDALESAGVPVCRETYTVRGRACHNVVAELAGIGDSHEIVLIGAHYDSVRGGPGANDNASGVAALLALARALATNRLSRTLRFVAFVNEEPPYIRTKKMGSLVYARACRNRGDHIVAMLSLETLGCFPAYDPPLEDPWPAKLLRPLQGKFLALVANMKSRHLAYSVARTFRGGSDLPVRAIALPGFLPGVRSSDHWSFWQCGYPAIMATDTAPFRYPYYHMRYDTPDKLSYRALAEVVIGLHRAIIRLAMGNGR
jgi:Zn-dependent M28 family amino/carboxypeptidase